jgi:hypothetical protein
MVSPIYTNPHPATDEDDMNDDESSSESSMLALNSKATADTLEVLSSDFLKLEESHRW